MSTPRRFLLALALLPALLVLPAAPAAAAGGTGDDNTAVAVNTEDGASVFRLAFSIRRVANGVIDETNSAYALASCTDCQTSPSRSSGVALSRRRRRSGNRAVS